MSKSYSRRRSSKKNNNKNRHRQKTPNKVNKHRDRSRRKHEKRSYHRRSDRESSYSKSSSSSSSSQSSSVSYSTRQRRKTPHFKYRVGEMIGHKYRITRLLGTGTFGRVLEARYDGSYYAIKVIKPVQKYIDSAKTERNIIKDLCRRDPEDEYHLVRYFESLYHYNHYCLVFETLGPSLYDVIKMNKYVGYPPYYVQSFAKQLFRAIGFMHRNGYTHTDLKPENILLRSSSFSDKNQKIKIPSSSKIKLIDFGGATHQSQSHSSVINTRQYRCPEVLLQTGKWNESSDLWSLGCILVELATGNLLFPVHNDVDHIYMIDRLISKFPSRMVEKCDESLLKYFNKDGSINYHNGDRDVKDWDTVMDAKPLYKQLKGYEGLQDLVRCCLVIDPKRRITCEEALKHQYFSLNLDDQRYWVPKSSEN